MADRPARQPAGTPEPQVCVVPGMGRRRVARQRRRFDHAHLESHDHARAAGHDPAAGSDGTTTVTDAPRALPRAGPRGAGPGAPSRTTAQLSVVNPRHHGHIGRELSSRIQRYPQGPRGTSASPRGGGSSRWSASRTNGPRGWSARPSVTVVSRRSVCWSAWVGRTSSRVSATHAGRGEPRE